MANLSRKFPHIYLSENGKSEIYTKPPGGGGSPSHPSRDRAIHAKHLETVIGIAMQEARQQLDSRDPEISTGVSGFYLEFQVQDDAANIFEKLEDRGKKIELVAVKPMPDKEGMLLATVFVPEKHADYFLKKVEKYRDQNTKKGKEEYFVSIFLLIELFLSEDFQLERAEIKESMILLLSILVRMKHRWAFPPKNEKLVSRVETVQLGKVKSLFTDIPSIFPQNGQEVWWEVWLRDGRHNQFNQVTQRLNIQTKSQVITFPEHKIVLATSNVEMMAQVIIDCPGAIAELKIAKDIPSMFLEMDMIEQADWSENLADRLIAPGKHSVAVSLLDSGVTQIHPLLALGLTPEDMHTVEPSWGINDSAYWSGHGTAMAGVSLYADLFEALGTSGDVKLLHRLESIKILPTNGENDPELYGAITEQGVFLPEIKAPNRRRVFCMAVTSRYGSTDKGTPSSWSAAVDKLCFNENDFRRLMIISAGNISEEISPSDYLNINDVQVVENPSQAWNPIIVGAYTEKINILDPGYFDWKPIAPSGDLSPCSRTSVIWENQWPIRPDVVFEGGNLASDGQNPGIPIRDFCLLTTHHVPVTKKFNDIRDTSCATALASYMAARIMSEQPTYQPETVRALMVHSAEWTPAMLKHFDDASSKTAKRSLVRRYGYGVPDLGRALQSASNDLTLIAEDKLQPFHLVGSAVKTKNMNLHKLPWPSEELEKLGAVDVELKITLSYFIEPNPGERGWAAKHRYASHGLRFKVKSSLETDKDFKGRISTAVRDEEEARRSSDNSQDENWFLGPTTRDCGSIHCDIWKGTAVELSKKDAIAVYPVGGWWKEKKYLERYNQISHYTLIVSVRVPGVDVDIYTPVANLVRTAVLIEG
jgi:hypothetical protein